MRSVCVYVCVCCGLWVCWQILPTTVVYIILINDGKHTGKRLSRYFWGFSVRIFREIWIMFANPAHYVDVWKQAFFPTEIFFVWFAFPCRMQIKGIFLKKKNLHNCLILCKATCVFWSRSHVILARLKLGLSIFSPEKTWLNCV